MASPGDQSATAAKSKQERIRDNQRRSRARRQEYMADLERRLNECHLTCREAELQRAAYGELQQENSRLRELLSFTGISPEVVETYLHQGASRRGSDPPASLRQLKARIRPSEMPLQASMPAHIPTTTELSAGECKLTATSPRANSVAESTSSSCKSRSRAPNHVTLFESDFPNSNAESRYFLNTFSSDVSQLPALADPSSLDWLLGQHSDALATPSTGADDDFCCDTFLVPPNGLLVPDDGNAILCSVAKAMLEQYNVAPQEMESIKGRLATGFTRPAYPGLGCRVNNQVLFEVLNEISINQD